MIGGVNYSIKCINFIRNPAEQLFSLKMIAQLEHKLNCSLTMRIIFDNTRLKYGFYEAMAYFCLQQISQNDELKQSMESSNSFNAISLENCILH